MRRRLTMAFTLIASGLLAGCTPGGSALTGTTWQLTAITEQVPAFQGVIPAEDQGRYTITFNSNGSFDATADCNQVSGTYKTTGSSGLSITPGPSTFAFCGEESFGDLFVHGLSRAASYAIANRALTITLQDAGTMTFAAATASGSAAGSTATVAAASGSANSTAKATKAPAGSATPAGLAGKTWQLTAITEKTAAFQGNVPAADQKNYTIEFQSDSTFSAKADCNNVAGTFATADPAATSGDLEIVPGPSTRAACPEGSLADLYVLGLGNAASYAIADGALTITLHDSGTLTFK
jgi:heat shock protein HslJ